MSKRPIGILPALAALLGILAMAGCRNTPARTPSETVSSPGNPVRDTLEGLYGEYGAAEEEGLVALCVPDYKRQTLAVTVTLRGADRSVIRWEFTARPEGKTLLNYRWCKCTRTDENGKEKREPCLRRGSLIRRDGNLLWDGYSKDRYTPLTLVKNLPAERLSGTWLCREDPALSLEIQVGGSAPLLTLTDQSEKGLCRIYTMTATLSDDRLFYRDGQCRERPNQAPAEEQTRYADGSGVFTLKDGELILTEASEDRLRGKSFVRPEGAE